MTSEDENIGPMQTTSEDALRTAKAVYGEWVGPFSKIVYDPSTCAWQFYRPIRMSDHSLEERIVTIIDATLVAKYK